MLVPTHTIRLRLSCDFLCGESSAGAQSAIFPWNWNCVSEDTQINCASALPPSATQSTNYFAQSSCHEVFISSA